MDETRLLEFGNKYTAAWCSQSPARVAAFFAENGSLQINQGAPSVGRAAIANAAQGFMTAFPDMVVAMDSVSIEGSRAVYQWTFGADGLIAESKGHFDEAEYNRQLKVGFGG